MNGNPYSFTAVSYPGVKPAPRPRKLTIARFAHVFVMFCQFSFWIWILYDQHGQWKTSTQLLVFFSAMVTLFGIGIILDVLCLCRSLGNSEVYFTMISFAVCLVLAVFMAGAQASIIIGSWTAFSAAWAAVCVTRITVINAICDAQRKAAGGTNPAKTN